MSRKRSSSKQLPTEDIKQSQTADCAVVEETTAPPIEDDTCLDPTDSKLANLVTTPINFVTSAYAWLSCELGKLAEEKATATTEDPIKFIPSIVSFVLCLLLVKNYAEFFDIIFTPCLGYSANLMRKLYDTMSNLTCDDLEGLAAFAVVVLCWIGAFKILSNVVRKVVEIRRVCIAKGND